MNVLTYIELIPYLCKLMMLKDIMPQFDRKDGYMLGFGYIVYLLKLPHHFISLISNETFHPKNVSSFINYLCHIIHVIFKCKNQIDESDKLTI